VDCIFCKMLYVGGNKHICGFCNVIILPKLSPSFVDYKNNSSFVLLYANRILFAFIMHSTNQGHFRQSTLLSAQRQVDNTTKS
jgi:hypothetical protein